MVEEHSEMQEKIQICVWQITGHGKANTQVLANVSGPWVYRESEKPDLRGGET